MSALFPSSRRIPAADALEAASLPRRVREALLSVHEAVVGLVIDPLDRLIPQIEVRLAHVRDRGSQHAVGVSYIEEAQLLGRRQAAFISGFAQAVDAELAALRRKAREPVVAGGSLAYIPTFEELRLVEDDEADEETEIKAIALRQESRAPLPIHLLCQRFGVLGESPAFDPGRLPVGPRRLCELMRGAGEANGFGLSLRIALLREFDRGVLVDYPSVAETLDDLLARHRVMPGLSFVPLRPRARVAAIEAAGASAERERPHTGWTGAPAAEADVLTFQVLQDLLASRRSTADRFRGGGRALGPVSAGAEAIGASGRAVVPTAVVLEILRDGAADAPRLDFDAIRQWVLLKARHRQGEAVVLSRIDSDVFELLALMYAHLFREVRPDSPAVGMLEKLRLPLLRLVLADAEFFLHAAHPARELLNAVAESGARCYAVDDIDPQLLLHLERIVDAVAQAREGTTSAFRHAVASLETQMQAVVRRSEITERRNVEAARGKDKLAIARQRATAVIDEALAARRLPLFHRSMLRHAWADVLTLAHLRHGDDSPEWQTLVEATRELVRASAGDTPAGPDLVLLVDHWLVTVGYHADDAGRIARLLAGTAADDDDEAATRTELMMRLKTRARLGEGSGDDEAAETALDADARAQAQRIRDLPPGTWFEVDGDDGSMMRRRLSWLSPVTGLALFVNPRGHRVADTSMTALARELAAGRARVVTAADGRLVDRAWRAALYSLASGAARSPEARA